jgi:hypothetical protein
MACSSIPLRSINTLAEEEEAVVNLPKTYSLSFTTLYRFPISAAGGGAFREPLLSTRSLKTLY